MTPKSGPKSASPLAERQLPMQTAVSRTGTVTCWNPIAVIVLAILTMAILTGCVHVIDRPGTETPAPAPTPITDIGLIAATTPAPSASGGTASPPGTPEPGPPPTAVPSPTPTESADAIAVASPEQTPTPTAMAPPTATPVATAVPPPNSTPEATTGPTVDPTRTPEGGQGPDPTPSPTPIGTPTPEPTPTPDPEDLPFLNIESPKDGDIIREPSVLIQGTASVGASVSAKGRAVSVGEGGKFRLWVPLSPGVNILDVFVINPDGQRQGRTLTVTYLPLEPFFLTITQPREQDRTVTTDTVRLWGRTAPDATLTVNGIAIPLDQHGIFSTTITLNPGGNSINVIATSSTDDVLQETLEIIYQEEQ